ncbi:MAG: tetratricopeptide repeat protein [Lachnospiraceae bacterium]
MKKIQLLSSFVLMCLLASCQAGSKSYQKGLEAYESYDYSEALRLMKQAISQDDSVADYYVGLGMAQIHMNEMENSIESFEYALELEENNQQAMRGMGIAYMSMGDYEQAVESFQKALDMTASSVLTDLELDILKYLADSQMKAGRYEDAYQSYESLIKLDIDVVQNTLYQAEAYMGMGDKTKALEKVESVLKMDWKNYDIYIEAYRILEDYNFDGEMVLKQALELEVSSAEDYLNRGNIYYLLGEFDLAISDFSMAYEAGEREAGVYIIRCYAEQGQWDEANELWNSYKLESENNNAKVYYQMSLVKMKMEEYEEAKQLISQALILDDGTWTKMLKWNEAVLYEYMQDYQTAYEKFNAYGSIYGYSEEVQREMTYVKTR